MSSSVNLGGQDRQLKKIYDCLNIGSNKKAVQEVDRLPKNVRDLTVFKTLKSLALIRMQKTIQALKILDEINLEADLDEVTLQTMTSCCKESVNVGRIVKMYEAAAKRKPDDLDIMSHLFMAYVRVFNFKRQKEVAMQMYKNFTIKKRLHSFWAIMSLVMQSQANRKPGTAETPDSKVCLSLAEKMCEKMIDEERVQEEIELYLTILRKQNKHEEEYKFLTGPVCSRITDHLSWYKRRQAYLCLDLKMYSRAFKHYFPTLIQEYPDQIEYYQGLFKSAFILDTEIPSQQQPLNGQQTQAPSAAGTPVKFNSALAECIDIVEKQCQLCLESQESIAKDPQQKGAKIQSKNVSRTSSLNPTRRGLLRGPFMARVDLFNMIQSNEKLLPENVYNLCKSQFVKHPNLVSILLDFFQLFSRKVICFYDLDYMLNRYKLTSEDKEKLVLCTDEWVKNITENPPSEFKPHDIFYIQLNYHLLQHSLQNYGTSDPLCDRMKFAKKFIDIYDTQRELAKNSSTKTEFLPVDHYCLLAINSIMTKSIDLNMFQKTAQPILTDTILVSIITMAESAVMNSPSNHQLKLILLKLYSLIGASKQSSEVLISLDIKHFQIDTLGHLLNPVLYNTGNFTLSKESLDTCLGFYAHGMRECYECLTTGYKEGRFSKIEEITNVLRRLYNSLNAAQCFLIRGVVNNVTAATQDELFSTCSSFDPFNGLHRVFHNADNSYQFQDSRDYKVLKSLHLDTNSLVQQRQNENLADEQLWLRLRYYLLRSAFMQFELLSGRKTMDKIASQVEFEMASKEIDLLLPRMLELAKDYKDDCYSYLEPEASPFKWRNIKIEPLVNLVKLIVFCTNLNELTPEVLDKYSLHLDEIINNVEQNLSITNSLITFKQTLSALTLSVEFLSLCVTSLVSLNHLECTITSNNTNAAQDSTAKTSSTGQHQPVAKTKSSLNQMISKTEAQLLRLSNLIKGVDPKALIIDRISHLDERLLSNSKHSSIVTKDGSNLNPLLGPEAQSVTLAKVKDDILESYSESLKEIENTCRRKIKLLRSKA